MPLPPPVCLALLPLFPLAGAALIFKHGASLPPLSFIFKKKQPEAQPPRKPTRKALLIGVRYKYARSYRKDVPVDLGEAPHREVETWKGNLTDYFSYESDDVTCMVDDDRNDNPGLWPCHQNILVQLEALVEDIRPGDRRFLFVAGHGGLLPYEANSTGSNGNVFYTVECGGTRLLTITNDNLRQILVDRIPEGAKLTVVFELCNSGTLLDLPYRIDTDEHGVTTFTDVRSPAEDVPGKILCLSACENWQKAHHFISPGAKQQSIITTVVAHTLQENGRKGCEPSLNLIHLHRELLKPPDKSSQAGQSEGSQAEQPEASQARQLEASQAGQSEASQAGQTKAIQTPVVTIGKRISADTLQKLRFRP